MSTIQDYVKEASKKLSETGKKTGLMVKIGERESSQCEVNFRRGLCNNIVVYGPSAFRGLSERLQLEIQKKFQGSIEVSVSSL
jgi:actin-related protein